MTQTWIRGKEDKSRQWWKGSRSFSGNRGFTLVEILIVLAILAVLSFMAITSIAFAFERGAEQAYATDLKTIQSVVSLFYHDGHACDTTPPADAWDSSANPVFGHYYPTSTGFPPDKTITEILADANATGSTYNFPGEAIWMGLLSNSPLAVSTHDRDGAAPLVGEMGPYFNGIPDSASSNNYSTACGSYTWVVAADQVVYGVFWDGSSWQVGFSGSYP